MDYLEINKALWNARTAVHIDSDFYDITGFVSGKNSLNEIELDQLGNIQGQSILHLQCHFGQDSLSLARLGAKVTGVDFSEKAIEKARELSAKIGSDARFICADIYDLSNHLNEKFDIVFTSYGTIGWLPDLDRWGSVISHFLKPGGKFVFAEFHPVIWMFDNDFQKITYSYFKTEPIVEMEESTYADTSAVIHKESVTWNHAIAEVISALLSNGLEISSCREFNYSPYNCFSKTKEIEPGKYIIEPFGNNIPMVYALSAIKK